MSLFWTSHILQGQKHEEYQITKIRMCVFIFTRSRILQGQFEQLTLDYMIANKILF